VCLGHQAIGLALGAQVHRAGTVMHGRTSVIDHDGQGCFTGLEQQAQVTRYHSLVVDSPDSDAGTPAVGELLTPDLIVTARSHDDGTIMGLRHRTLAVESVQFHPESILTHAGAAMFTGFLDTHVLAPAGR
jgi:anthranilate synthase component 2